MFVALCGVRDEEVVGGIECGWVDCGQGVDRRGRMVIWARQC